MFRIIGLRVAQVVPTLLLVTLVVFALQRVIPGGPALAILGENATPERIAELNHQLGLDQPFFVQYGEWLVGVLTGNLGISLATGETVATLLAERLPGTVTIGIAAMIISIAIGVPLGIVAAMRQGTRLDSFVTAIATLGVAVPSFWLGILFVLLFGIFLGWLPSSGFIPLSTDPIQSLRRIILPALALGIVGAAEICRQLRSAMIEVLHSDFIRTHNAKGLPRKQIVWVHALKNSALPLTTIIGLRVSSLLGATVVVESLFAIPGIGTLAITAISTRDYPVIQGVVLLSAVIVIATNLVVDLTYRMIDPRIGARDK